MRNKKSFLVFLICVLAALLISGAVLAQDEIVDESITEELSETFAETADPAEELTEEEGFATASELVTINEFTLKFSGLENFQAYKDFQYILYLTDPIFEGKLEDGKTDYVVNVNGTLLNLNTDSKLSVKVFNLYNQLVIDCPAKSISQSYEEDSKFEYRVNEGYKDVQKTITTMVGFNDDLIKAPNEVVFKLDGKAIDVSQQTDKTEIYDIPYGTEITATATYTGYKLKEDTKVVTVDEDTESIDFEIAPAVITIKIPADPDEKFDHYPMGVFEGSDATICDIAPYVEKGQTVYVCELNENDATEGKDIPSTVTVKIGNDLVSGDPFKVIVAEAVNKPVTADATYPKSIGTLDLSAETKFYKTVFDYKGELWFFDVEMTDQTEFYWELINNSGDKFETNVESSLLKNIPTDWYVDSTDGDWGCRTSGKFDTSPDKFDDEVFPHTFRFNVNPIIVNVNIGNIAEDLPSDSTMTVSRGTFTSEELEIQSGTLQYGFSTDVYKLTTSDKFDVTIKNEYGLVIAEKKGVPLAGTDYPYTIKLEKTDLKTLEKVLVGFTLDGEEITDEMAYLINEGYIKFSWYADGKLLINNDIPELHNIPVGTVVTCVPEISVLQISPESAEITVDKKDEGEYNTLIFEVTPLEIEIKLPKSFDDSILAVPLEDYTKPFVGTPINSDTKSVTITYPEFPDAQEINVIIYNHYGFILAFSYIDIVPVEKDNFWQYTADLPESAYFDVYDVQAKVMINGADKSGDSEKVTIHWADSSLYVDEDNIGIIKAYDWTTYDRKDPEALQSEEYTGAVLKDIPPLTYWYYVTGDREITCQPESEDYAFRPNFLTKYVNASDNLFEFEEMPFLGGYVKDGYGNIIEGAKVTIARDGNVIDVIETDKDGSYQFELEAYDGKAYDLTIDATVQGYDLYQNSVIPASGGRFNVILYGEAQNGVSIAEDDIRTKVGTEIQLTITHSKSIEEINYVLTDGDHLPIRDFGDGKLLAEAPTDGKIVSGGEAGVVYFYAYGYDENSVEYSDFCRIEFFDIVEVDNVISSVTKLTINPNRTDLVELPIAIQLNKGIDTGENVDEEEETRLGLIQSATLLDNNQFELVVVNDKTLSLQAKAGVNVFPSKFTSRVSVSISLDNGDTKKDYIVTDNEGKDLIVTVTVKDVLPTIKVEPVKLNSGIFGDSAEIVVTGGDVVSIDRPSTPGWLIFKDKGQNKFFVVYNYDDGYAPKFTDATLVDLSIKLNGWKDTFKKVVKVSAAPSKLALTVKQEKQARIDFNNPNKLNIIIKDKKYAQIYEQLSVISVQDGKTSFAADDEKCPLSLTATHNVVDGLEIPCIEVQNNDNTVARKSYVINFTVGAYDYSYTYKVNPMKKGTVATSVKGDIDLAIYGSYATYSYTAKDVNPDGNQKVVVYRNCDNKKTTCTKTNDVTDWFDADALDEGKLVFLDEKLSTVNTNDTFMVRALICYDNATCAEYNGDTSREVTKMAKLKVKKAKKVNPGVSDLIISGKLDYTKPDAYITVTPVFKDYMAAPESAKLLFFKNGALLDDTDSSFPFEFSPAPDGISWIIKANHSNGITDYKATYSVNYEAELATGKTSALKYKAASSVHLAKPKVFKVVHTTPSVTIDSKTLTLYKGDPTAVTPFKLSVDSSKFVDIVNVEMAKKVHTRLMVQHSVRGNSFVGFLDTKSVGTTGFEHISLNVFLAGNNTKTPDAVVNVKVYFK